MIGLFDSGLGGLTVVRRVREHLPKADLVFFADQAHVPYGDRTHEDLLHLLHDNLAWLDAQDVEAIAMACNTSCAIAERYGWPATRATVLDLIDSAATAVERGGWKKVGVVATAATVGAGSYGRTLRARIPGIDVVEVPAPALVPMVEAGKITGNEPREAVGHVCDNLPIDLEAVILGCTHYPVLAGHFVAALGPNIALIDPATIQAERAAALLGDRANGNGTTRYVTNGDLAVFRQNIIRMMNEPDPQTDRILVLQA
jgi:glutamate racemase